LKLSDLFIELEDSAKDDSKAAILKTQGSKARKTLENRAFGIRHTIELMRGILKREVFKAAKPNA